MNWLGHQDKTAKLDSHLAARGGLAEALQDKARVAEKGVDESLNAYVVEIVRRAYPVAAWQEVFSLLSPLGPQGLGPGEG